LHDGVPEIQRLAREPLQAELILKNQVYDRILVNEKDYYLKLRALCQILKSTRMLYFYK